MTWKDLWRRETLGVRLLLIAGIMLGLLFAADLIGYIAIGFMDGTWNLSAMTILVGKLVVVAYGFEYARWRRRALDAEKPLDPTQVIETYDTVGAANWARYIQQLKQEERANDRDRIASDS